MRKPTKIQIKEMWKGCGLHYTEPYWVDDNNNLAFYGETHSELLGNLDLNNLFEYAKPAVVEKFSRVRWEGILFAWMKEMMFGQDPTLALFWAIWEAGKE